MGDFDNFPNYDDFEGVSPGEYTYDFDYTYTFRCKPIQRFSEGFTLFPEGFPVLPALQALPRSRLNSSSSLGNDSPYPDSSYSSCRSNLSRRYSSSSFSSSSENPSTMNANYMATIGTHMYDNPGTISSSTTAYVSRERFAALEYLEKNISTIISEQVRQHYDGYTVSSDTVE
jgi:hypothetical protein